MKLCKKCNKQFSENSLTCDICRGALEEFDEVSKKKYNKVRRISIALGMVNIILVIVVVSLFVDSYNGSKITMNNTNETMKIADNTQEIEDDVTISSQTENNTGITISTFKMPNLINVKKSIAESNLMNNGLIPIFVEEYSDDIAEGNVTRTEPAEETLVAKNQNVKIYVSKGPSIIYPVSGTINWENSAGNWNDKYSFTSAKIEYGVMYLSVRNCDIEHQPQTVTGVKACNDKSFSNYTSVTVSNLMYQSKKYDTYYIKKINYGYDIEIPLEKLNVNKPSNMYVIVHYDDADSYSPDVNVMLSFSFVW